MTFPGVFAFCACAYPFDESPCASALPCATRGMIRRVCARHAVASNTFSASSLRQVHPWT
eukprot:2224785-Alexandrium_andersonii.AAC.1